MVSELWPHRVKKIHEMFSVSFNMGCCMCGQGLPAWLENSRYCMNHLESALYPLLQDVDLQTRIYLWFMHDGAPPHFNRIAHQYLNDHFPGRWVRRNGPVAWPAHSLDLNPIDFYLWGHVNLSLLHTPHQRWRVMGTHRSHIWCHQEPTRSTGTYQGICDGQHFEHLMWYPKGYQHMNISQYLWTCSLLDPCW